MEADLTCTVCLDLYKDPHLLPCSHNLCRGCVRALIKDDTCHDVVTAPPSPEADEAQLGDSSIAQSMSDAIHQLSGWFSTHIKAGKTNNNAQDIPFKLVIICPTCRAKYDVGPNGVDQFSKNLTLANIVSTYKSKRKVFDTMTDSEDEIPEDEIPEHEIPKDEILNEIPETSSTNNDDKKSSDKTSKHPEEVNSEESNIRHCTKHHGKRNKMFCSTCNSLVCSSCALFGDHKGHDIVKLRSALRTGKRLLEDELVKVEKLQLCLLKRKDAIVEYTCKLDEIKTRHLESMRKECVQIINEIQANEKELTEGMQKDVQKKKDILVNFEKDYIACSESVQILNSDILKVLSISDPIEFLDVYMAAVNRARNSNISLQDLDPSLKTVLGNIPDFQYFKEVLQRGLAKKIPHRGGSGSTDDDRTAKREQKKNTVAPVAPLVPGRVAQCQFMEPFYVVEDLIDVAIGAGGVNIQEARKVEGVTSVELEFGDMCSFKFYGTSQDACDKSRDVLQKAMIQYMSNN